MYTIERNLEIAAPFATLHTAMTTRAGFRAWLAADTRVDAAGRYRFSFGPRSVTFTLDRADARGIAMTCVQEHDNPDWLGTQLAITLIPMTEGKTRVEFVHSGYPSKNECYSQCIKGWEHFLGSLALYATTGRGLPFDAAANGPPPSRASSEVSA